MPANIGCFAPPVKDIAVASLASGTSGIRGISKDATRVPPVTNPTDIGVPNSANPGSRSMLFVQTERSAGVSAEKWDIQDLVDAKSGAPALNTIQASQFNAELTAAPSGTVAILRTFHILYSAVASTTNRTSDEIDITTRSTDWKPTDPQSATVIKQYIPGAEDFRLSGSGFWKRNDAAVRLSKAFSAKQEIYCVFVEYNHAMYRGVFTVLEWSVSNDLEQSMQYTYELRASGDVEIDVVDYF